MPPCFCHHGEGLLIWDKFGKTPSDTGAFHQHTNNKASKAVPFINISMGICGGFYGFAVVPWVLDKRSWNHDEFLKKMTED